MDATTLKSLHAHLRLIENVSELKKKMPSFPKPKTMKEAFGEISKLAGLESAAFDDPQIMAALVGPQRFAMICGEISVTEHVARVFDSSRVLTTVLLAPGHFEKVTPKPTSSSAAASPPLPAAKGALSMAAAPSNLEPPLKNRASLQPPGLPTPQAPPNPEPVHKPMPSHQPPVLPTAPVPPNPEPPAPAVPPSPEPEAPVDDLKPLIVGNMRVTCRIFRAVFEQILGFASVASAQQGNAFLINELTNNREPTRSILAAATFVLGSEVDRQNLPSFMMQQALFGIPTFEHMLLNRDYCDAFHVFRRFERAFMGAPALEEAELRNQLDRLNAQFGGKPCGGRLFEVDEPDKAKLDAYRAAADLLEALTLAPWCMSLHHAVSVDPSYSLRSVATIAAHFERLAHAETTKDLANQAIASHLLAFARQFSTDRHPA